LALRIIEKPEVMESPKKKAQLEAKKREGQKSVSIV